VLVVPLYLVSYYLRVNGLVIPVIVAHLTFVLPSVTWFLISFFDDIPRDLEQAALIDGCTRFQAFLKVVLPQVLPGLGAAAIFGFVLSWNDMFYALILGGETAKTLPVAIAGYTTRSAASSWATCRWPSSCPCCRRCCCPFSSSGA